MVIKVFNMFDKYIHFISSYVQVILMSSCLVSSAEFQIDAVSNARTSTGTSNEDSHLQGMKIVVC